MAEEGERTHPAEAAKEAPIVPPPPGTVADIFAEVLPEVRFTATQAALDVILIVPPDQIHHTLKTAREHPRLAFDFLRCISGVDQLERGIEIVYQLYSYRHRHNVTIKTHVPRQDGAVPTTTDVWRGADWLERETAELLGVSFTGHPHLVPLLLEEGLEIHPLRKDHPLAEVKIKQGEEVLASVAAAAGSPAEGVGAAPAGQLSPEEREARIAAAKEKATAAVAARQGAAGPPRSPLSPEEREARIAAAKERAAQIKAAREAAQAGPPAGAAAQQKNEGSPP